MQDGAIVIKAELDSSDLDKGLKQTEAKVTNSANNLSKIIKGVGFSALLASAGKVAVDTAKKINDETEKVMAKLKGASTLYQGVAVNQEKLVQGLSAIAVQTGESLENLGQSVYDALSAGVKPTEDMSDVLSVVQKSAKLASAGFTDVSTALSATLKVVNAYGMGIEEVDRVQGILMQTQNSGITTVNELGAALAQVVPTAASFGLKFEDVGASLAEMTKQGTKTAGATTSLNAIISELGKNGTNASKNLKAAAESAGLSSTSFSELIEDGKSLGEILDIMNTYAEQSGLSMVDMFSSIEAGKGALQLSGKNLDDYKSILDGMGRSAGLVSEAFDKTVDPSKKLESAWQTLFVTIGSKFKPTADALRTTLADTITKLAGQEVASISLETSLEDLKRASNNLKSAQDEMKTSMDEATISMKIQSEQDFWLTMAQTSSDYLKKVGEIAKKNKTLADQKEGKKLAEDWLIAEAALRGYDADLVQFFQDYDRVKADKNGNLNSFFSADGSWITGVEENRERLVEFNMAIAQTESEIRGLENETKTFVNGLALLVKDEVVSLGTIRQVAPEMADAVEAVLPGLEKIDQTITSIATGGSGGSGGNGGGLEGTKTLLEEFAEATEALAVKYDGLTKAGEMNEKEFFTLADKVAEMTDLYISFVEKGLDPGEKAMEDFWYEIEKVDASANSQVELWRLFVAEQKDVMASYNALKNSGTEVGKSMASQQTLLSQLEALYASYVQKGLRPTNYAMQEVAKQIVTLREQINKQKTDSENLAETFKKMEDEYRMLEANGSLYEDSLYSQEDEIKSLTDLYARFAKVLSSTDPTMVAIKKRLDELGAGAEKAKASWKDLGKEMKTSLEQSAKSLASGFGSAIEEGLLAWLERDKAIKDLEEEILEQRKKLADYSDDLADAEEDYAKAVARGDEREIRDAKKKVDNLRDLKKATQDVINAKESDKKATEDGTNAWKTFGKSAVMALAQTLEGIGAQLAGLSVVHGLALDVGGAGLAFTGSLAAFGAAAGLKAWAGTFANGGIIKGDSYTGDRMIASVNAGELILNTAQQETLARVLEASVSLAQINAAGGGGAGITVNLEGASIYGLDEPAVGRAIYDNIQNLKHEGVI